MPELKDFGGVTKQEIIDGLKSLESKEQLPHNKSIVPIDEIRRIGRNLCRTEGSKHYRATFVDAIELLAANNIQYAIGFCIGNIIKYTIRQQHTKNPEDIKKVADYAQIWAGLNQMAAEEQTWTTK